MRLDLDHFKKNGGKVEIREHIHGEQPSEQFETEEPKNSGSGVLAIDDTCRDREDSVEILPPSRSPTLSLVNIDPSYRVPNALRGIDLAKIQSRATLMSQLTQNLPLNDYNLPKFIYRPDLLDYTLFNQPSPEQQINTPNGQSLEIERYREMQDQLDMASIQLEYHEGYPSLGGLPFWSKLPFESVEDHSLFEIYLRIPGARQLALVPNTPLERLTELFHLYYWGLRALAHDTFAIAHYQRMRQQRILASDNKHFLKAEAILNELETRFKHVEWDMVKDPEIYVSILEKVVKLQRAALGQSANGANEKAPQTPNLEVIMRSITAQPEDPLKAIDQAQQGAMEILSDPELTESAQELIIRYGKRGHG